MLCYIKDLKTFETISKFDSTEYSLPDGDKGEIRIYQKNAIELTSKYVRMWAIINKELFYISGATPSDDYVTLTIQPPIYAFTRQVELPNLSTYGALVKSIIDDNFGVNCPDTEYQMSYISVSNTDTTPCSIEADEYGYVIPYEVFDDALYDGVAIDFSFSNTGISINIYTANYDTGVVVFNDGSTTLESESYDENFIAKATVIHSLGRDDTTEEELYEVIDYYLSADNHISTTPPVNRAKGIWKYYTADQDTSPLSVAVGAFSHNDENHKIEFYSPKRFALYQPIKMRLRNDIFYTIIASRVQSSNDNRYYYKCGRLVTTLTEKIDSEASTTNQEIKVLKKKLEMVVGDDNLVPIKHGGTDATTAREALLNLGALDLNQGTKIPNNSDLNDYTTPGTYYVLSSTEAATMLHGPLTSTGYKLVVFIGSIGNRIHQVAFRQGTNYVYIRARDNATWTGWDTLLATNVVKSYINARGTANGWTYQKYSDGHIEAWRTINTTLTHYR